jgi:YggT family protein
MTQPPAVDEEAETSTAKKYLAAMSPRFLWATSDGYPVVLKQFVQFCLIIIYPAWVFGVLVMATVHLLFYVTVYPLLWLLFWPVRAYQKKYHPEEYAASQQK